MPGRERFRAGLLRYVEVPGAKLLRALGFTPNAITILGFLLCVAAAVLVAYGQLLPGGIVFLVGGGLDLFDGGLARLTGTESPFGALLDSVFDRLGEAALLVGLGIYGLRSGLSDDNQLLFVLVVMLALVFSMESAI